MTQPLRGTGAERDMLEGSAHRLALGHVHLCARDDRGHEPRLHRRAVDLRRDETRQDLGALAVADEHDAAALIVPGEIGPPGRQHVGVGESARRQIRVRIVDDLAEARARHLAVERRKGPADGAKAHELLLGGARLVLGRRDRRVVASGMRDRRVDVEAIDRRGRIGRVGDFVAPSASREDRRGGRRRADVGAAGPAQPGGGGAIVGRRGRLSRDERQHLGQRSGEQHGEQRDRE